MKNVNEILQQTSKKPQSVLRIVLGIAVVMLVMWLFLVSRMELQTEEQQSPEVLTEQTADQPQVKSLKQSLLESTQQGDTEEMVPAPVQEVPSEQESRSMLSRALPTFVIMMVVLAGIWIWARRKQNNNSTVTESRELGKYDLGQGSQLRFVEINHEVWVLAVGTGSVELLHRYPRSEWSDEQAEAAISKADFRSFYNLLKN